MIKFLLLVLMSSAIALSQESLWVQTNGPLGGQVDDIVSISNTQFALTLGGIFRTTDAGSQWSLVYSRGGNDLAKDSRGNIYLANGRVIRSTDNGNSWHRTQGTFVHYAFTLAINTMGHIFAETLGNEVYRSTNDGVSWEYLSTGLPSQTQGWSIAVNHNGTIFLGDHQSNVFRSTDNGTTWQLVLNAGLLSRAKSIEFNEDGHVYVATERTGIYRSMDDGNSRSAINNGLTNRALTSVSVRPNGLLIVGTDSSGVFRSTDNGDNWTASSFGITNRQIASVCLLSNSNALVGTGSGAFRSSDGGITWRSSTAGLIATSVSSIASNNTGDIFAGTWFSGVFRSSDLGTNWIEISNGLSTNSIWAIATEQNNTLYAGGLRGLYRSTNNGIQWTTTNLSAGRINFVISRNDGTVFAGTEYEGIYRSVDRGETWIRLSSGLPQSTTLFCLSQNNSGDLFAGVNQSLFRSTDNGENWSSLNWWAGEYMASLVAGSQDNLLIATTRSGKLFRSSNSGQSWTQVVVHTDTTLVWCLTKNSLNHIFVGCPFGVFRSTDEAATWQPFSSGLGDIQLNTLAVSKSGYLLAGTYGSGVFTTRRSTTFVVERKTESPNAFGLGQNYPNPFNAQSSIDFSMPTNEFVELKIYDTVGREVETLLSETLNRGSYRITFDAGKLASGIYLYKLRAGNSVESKKMSIIK